MSITIRACDDWVAMYKDDEKVWENHSCPLREGLEVLGIVFKYEDLHDRVDDLGRLDGNSEKDPFPETLPG